MAASFFAFGSTAFAFINSAVTHGYTHTEILNRIEFERFDLKEKCAILQKSARLYSSGHVSLTARMCSGLLGAKTNKGYDYPMYPPDDDAADAGGL